MVPRAHIADLFLMLCHLACECRRISFLLSLVYAEKEQQPEIRQRSHAILNRKQFLYSPHKVHVNKAPLPCMEPGDWGGALGQFRKVVRCSPEVLQSSDP